MIIFTIFVYFKVPETKNKTFEEIASVFAPGTKIEVEEIVEDDVFSQRNSADGMKETDKMLQDGNPPPYPGHQRNGSLTSDSNDVKIKGPEEKMSLTKSEEHVHHLEA